MKPGDIIAWTTTWTTFPPGFGLGLIIGAYPVESGPAPFCIHEERYDASPFTVLWACGKVSRPARAFLGNYTVAL